MDLSHERWEKVSSAEREAIAMQLAMQLPVGFAFDSLRLCQLGGRENHIAFFRFGDSKFAFLPGTTVTLGYDVDRFLEPAPDELQSWEATAEEYGIEKSLPEYIEAATLRIRQADLRPLLIETQAKEPGWHPVACDDPEVREIVGKHGTGKTVQIHHGDHITRIRTSGAGSLTAERSVTCTSAELSNKLTPAGFRFPTSDEWEYACGGDAGAQTLFRWGDHVPCDRYPTDTSPAEAEWRRRWVLSNGKLEYPPEGFASDWDLHRRPNAFGLSIAFDPYKMELVAESGTTRGGDGGSMICGGAGFFVGWLTLATAYFEEHSCRFDPAKPISTGYTVARRVLELR